MLTVSARDFLRNGHQIHLNHKPDRCPLCHTAVDPRPEGEPGLLGKDPKADGAIVEVVYQCPRRDCFRFFIGRYQRVPIPGAGISNEFRLLSTAPSNHVTPTLPKEIGEISPIFAKVYLQASIAESGGLEEVAGIGYRKALEFLIKDYCVSQDPPSREAIEREPLGATIDKRVADPHVKECARRAAWLGNDETHYVRKWADKDISDLKTLIELTMNWIRSSVLTERYLSEMDPLK